MKKITVIAIILMLLSTGCSVDNGNKAFRFGKKRSLAKTPDPSEPPRLPVSTLSNAVDVHYSANYCTECHVTVPREGSHPQLRYGGDFSVLCRCHYSQTNNYIHPVDRKPSREMIGRIPAQFPLRQGKLDCSTCHDIVVQCRDNPLEREFLKEQKFLRGGPFETETSICYRCHDIAGYQMYNPHRQLNDQRELVEEKCLYCHSRLPDVKQTRSEDARLIGPLEALCTRCHMKTTEQDFHAKHVRKPSREVSARIKQLEEQQDIILPLSENGSITCSTCHNPHEEGVIPDMRAGAKGAGETLRHRLANKNQMCIKCHPMR